MGERKKKRITLGQGHIAKKVGVEPPRWEKKIQKTGKTGKRHHLQEETALDTPQCEKKREWTPSPRGERANEER